jgi:molecular chaperone HtpG
MSFWLKISRCGDFDKVVEKMGKILENQVKEVKISNRLSESPSCLVADENEIIAFGN